MKNSLGRGLGALIPGANISEMEEFPEILGTTELKKKKEIKTEVNKKISGAMPQIKQQTPQKIIFENFSEKKNILKEKFSEEKPLDKNGAYMVKIMNIEPCRTQPRKKFDSQELEQLSQSIKTHGIIQPIIVRSINEDRYEIIAGERRWRAAQKAGLKEIPVFIRNTDDNIMELALVENLQRVDLNPIDEAHGYQTLMEEYGITQEQISERIGKSRSAIANSLRLLSLPQTVRELVETGDISSGHARALLTLTDEDTQREVVEKIIRHDLSVRATEKLVKSIGGSGKRASEKNTLSDEMTMYLENIEKNMTRKFGTKVKITPGAKKSKIEIEYYTNKDLDRILKIISHME
ncbi:MAG: ParB/RepB/Spo0J family partition protein [Clostridiales bacterium]|jgi:ParB family chromosome partitioning protein|nr:ParB/RepB/Spo0J family partition protein [Clostridiales bacterium]